MPKWEFAWVVDSSVTVEADSEEQAYAEAQGVIKEAYGLPGLTPDLEFIGKLGEEG
jgi:hypothetical protein